MRDKSLLSPQKSPLGWLSETPVLLLGSPSAERRTEKKDVSYSLRADLSIQEMEMMKSKKEKKKVLKRIQH